MLSNSITRLFAFLLALLASVSASLRAQIASQPTAQSACEAITNGATVYGGTATFTVTATNPSSTYQWYMDGLALVNGTNVAGATSDTLVLSGLTRTDTGAQISVDVTSGGTTTSSSAATLTVNYLTVTRPSTVAFDRCVGTSWSVQLPVPQTSSALSALTYQWYKLDSNGTTGTALSGKTSRTLNIASVSMNDNGSYYCIVGNGTNCGVDGTGSGNTAVSSAGRSFDTKVYITLSVSNLIPFVTSVAGTANACDGTATSLSVYATLATSIDSSGNKTPATAGGRDALLTYQWQSSADGSTNWTNVSNSASITGATTRTLSFSSVAVNDGKYYRCSVTRTADTVAGTGCTSTNTTDSGNFLLAPYKAASIQTQPSSQSICPEYNSSGGTTSFTVVAANDANPAAQYQWQKDTGGGNWQNVTNGARVSGATSATLSFTGQGAGTNDAGDYRVRVYNVCNASSAVFSSTVTLSIKVQPSVAPLTSNRTNNTICTGDSIVLTAAGSGTGTLTYAWVKTAGANSGATTLSSAATYTISNAVSDDAGTYQVTVSGDCAPSASRTIVVTVNTPASVGASLNSPTVCEYVSGQTSGSNVGNGTAVISASISGTPTPTIRWELGGTPVADGTYGSVTISGATTATLTISGLSYGSTYAGTYKVYASTGCATEASNTSGGVVTVQRSTALSGNGGIVGSATQQWACAGSNITWVASAVGQSLQYQWESSSTSSGNYTDVTGATSATLTAAAPAQGTSVFYRCKVTGTCFPSTSGSATLTTSSVESIGKALAAIGNSGNLDNPNPTICPYDANESAGSNDGNGSTTLTVSFTQDGTNNPITSLKWYVRPAGSTNAADWAEVSGSGYSVSALTTTSTDSVLTITNLASSKEFYAAALTGCSVGSTPDFTSNTATVTVNPVVAFSRSASSLTSGDPICDGDSFAGYSVAAGDLSGAASADYRYQWQKSANGSTGWADLNGATLSSLVLGTQGTGANVGFYYPSPSDTGYYRCVIRSVTCLNPAYANVTGQLLVRAQPAIVTSPSAASVCPGVTGTVTQPTVHGSATFTATFTAYADGQNPVSVAWQRSNTGSGGWTTISNPDAAPPVATTGYTPSISGPDSNGVYTTTLTLSNIVAGDSRSGKYFRACIINACSSDTSGSAAWVSSGAQLTVYAQPSVTATSADVTACESQASSVSFSVTATGQGLTYIWEKSADGTSGWSTVSGATLSSLTFSPPVLGDAGYYRATVSGTCQTNSPVYSAVRQLTVNAKPTFVGGTQPSSSTVCPYVSGAGSNSGNGTVALTGTALGYGTISYQWQKLTGATWANVSDATGIVGSATNTLVLTGLLAGDSRLGSYRLHVTNTCTVQADDINSNTATVALYAAPSISAPPTSDTVCEGAAKTFSVTAAGDLAVSASALTYLWEKQSGANWSTVGGNASTLSFATVAISDGGTYRVTVSGRCAPSVTSSSFTLTVNEKPRITSLSDNSTCPTGSSTGTTLNVLTVVATGYDLHYAWTKVGGGSVGTDSATLTLPSVSSSDAGTYQVSITGACSNGDPAVTATATLTVHTPVSLSTVSIGSTSSPASGSDLASTIAAGQTLSLSVSASGSPSPTYQWKKGGSNVSGATLSSYTIANITTASAGTYTCAVTNTCGTSTTRNIVITVEDAGDKCYAVGSLPHTAAYGDINNDLANDLVVSNENSGTVSVMLNNRGLLEPSQTLTLASGAQPRGLTVADFNADGAQDVAVAVPNLGTVEVFYGRLSGGSPSGLLGVASGSNNVANATLNFGTGSPVAVASVRLDVSGKRRLIVCDLGSFLTAGNLYTVDFGVSGWGNPVSIASGGNFTSVAVGDLDGDGLDDIVAGNTSTANGGSSYGVHVLRATQKGFYSAVTGSPFNVGRLADAVSISTTTPVQGTSLRSIAVSSFSGFSPTSRGVSILTGSSLTGANAYSAASWTTLDGTAVLSSALGDIDGDGLEDLVYVAASGKGYVRHAWSTANVAEDLSAVSNSASGATRVILAKINPSNSCGAQTDMVFVKSANSGYACVLQPRSILLTGQPVAVTQCAGTTASLSVAKIGGGSSLVYQWQKSASGTNGSYTDITGANSATLSFNSLTTGDYGYYQCVLSNNCGMSQTSSAVVITVKVAPTVSTQPTGNTICRDGSHTFTVAGSPSGGSTATALSYQWQYSATSGGTFSNVSGSNLSGATTASLSVSNALVSQSGYYRCVVTNDCGSVNSNEAQLIVDVPAAITSNPVSGDFVCAGGSKTFTVTAEGTVGGVSSVNYQWYKTGSNTPLINVNPYSGVNTASLTIAPVATGLAGTYYCVVTNSCGNGSGTGTSSAATLDVRTYATISNPSNTSVCENTTASFSVNVTGTNTSNVNWYRSDAPTVAIPRPVVAGVSTLSFTAVRADHGVTFSASVTNECSTFPVSTTVPATLTVLYAPSVSQVGSASTTVCEGASSVSFEVSASPSSGANSSSLTYRWRYNGSDINLSDSHYSGANSATLTISSLVRGDAGNYSCRVSNSCSPAATSDNFALTVNYAPAITAQPTSSTSVCVNSVVTLSVTATGQPAPSYQWRKGGSNISGATLSSYTIPAAQSADAGTYTVVVSNSCNNVTSGNAVVSVNAVVAGLDTSCFSTAAGASMSVAVGSNVAVAVTGGVQLLSNNGSGVLSAGSVISLGGTPSAMCAVGSNLAVAANGGVVILSGSGLSNVSSSIFSGSVTSLAATGSDVVIGTASGLFICRASGASYAAAVEIGSGLNVSAVAAGDLLSNAGEEIVALVGAGASLKVYASSNLALLLSPASLSGSSSLALADLDRDGNLDAVAVAGSGGVQMHLGASLALASSQVTSNAAVSVVAGQFDNNSTGDLAYVLSTGSTVVASNINSSTGAAGSTSTTDCYGSGVHVAKVATASVGQSTGNCNTDELAVTRTATAQVCTVRFKCGQSVSSIAGSGCPASGTYTPATASTGGGNPVLGNNSFAISLSGAANYVYAATLMQLSTAGSVPVLVTLDAGCKHVFSAANGYTDVVQIAAITNGSGEASNRMPIPNTTDLISQELRTQWLLIDGGPMFGVTMGLSNGLLIRIGEY